jgi:hypothetical protein
MKTDKQKNTLSRSKTLSLKLVLVFFNVEIFF